MLNLDRPFIIAEAGTCHAHESYSERINLSFRYIDAAANCGADAVKFQWFRPPIHEDMFCWIDGDEERCPRWDLSALHRDVWEMIKRYADKRGIVFLASAFQHSTVQWLKDLRLEGSKVASRAAADFPYEIAPKPHLVSNGMYEPPEGVYVLHCETNYPSTMRWPGTDGFSDHSGCPDFAINALARGCKLIEVHYYIEESHAGPDLPASLTLDGLKAVCAAKDSLSHN